MSVTTNQMPKVSEVEVNVAGDVHEQHRPLTNDMNLKSNECFAFYGWIPSIVGWLSFGSPKTSQFMGFRALSKYQENDDRSTRTFSAIFGRNLTDKGWGFAPLTALNLFKVDAEYVETLAKCDREIPGAMGGHLKGRILTFCLKDSRAPFERLRKMSLRAGYDEAIELFRQCESELDRLTTIEFTLFRTGSCKLEIIRETNSNIVWKDDLQDQWDTAHVIANQAFIGLKELFHTHVAHNGSADSGVAVVPLKNVSTVISEISIQMRARLHRKYCAMLDFDPLKAKSYLIYLNIYLGATEQKNHSSAGGGDSKSIEPSIQVENSMYSKETYDNSYFGNASKFKACHGSKMEHLSEGNFRCVFQIRCVMVFGL
jgi:hypothetical protein